MDKLTNTEFIKLAHYAPNLAKEIYRDQLASEAINAWASFQKKLQPVSKRGHVDHWNRRKGRYTPMYHYVYFEDVKRHVNEAMMNTGLTWRQVPDVPSPVRVSVLDKKGNPTGQFTIGESVGIKTIIMFKNGKELSSGYMRTTSTSTSPKDTGSASTYCRRYSLCIATGIGSVPDKDGFQQPPKRAFPTPRMQNAPQRRTLPPVIGASRSRQLVQLITKVATKQGKAPNILENYIKSHFANNSQLSQMPMNQYQRVVGSLNNYIN